MRADGGGHEYVVTEAVTVQPSAPGRSSSNRAQPIYATAHVVSSPVHAEPGVAGAVAAEPLVPQGQYSQFATQVQHTGTPVGVSGRTPPTSTHEVGECRGCGRDFVRQPGTNPSSAEYFRCKRCQGVTISFCTMS